MEEEEEGQPQQQHPAPEPTTEFDRQLAQLRANELDSFDFSETMDGRNRARWTVAETLDVSNALMASTVKNLHVELAMCPPEALGLADKCIGSIQSLKHLALKYDCNFFSRRNGDSKELQQMYWSRFDSVLRAVPQNPSIIESLESLETHELGSTGGEISYLLSETTSLKKFVLHTLGDWDDPASIQTVSSVAEGLRRNSSLTQVEFVQVKKKTNSAGTTSSLGQLILGLVRHGSLEDFKVCYQRPDASFYVAMTTLLQTTSSLKKLEVRNDSLEDAREKCCNAMLLSLFQQRLFHPVGAGLKELRLVNIRIDMGWEKENFQKPTSASSNLENITLERVFFASPNDVTLLWHLTELRSLSMENTGVRFLSGAESGEDKERYSAVWKGFIERSPKLKNVGGWNVNVECVNGIWEGACAHEHLESLDFYCNSEWPEGWEIDASRGALLRRLLHETKSLKRLGMGYTPLEKSGAEQLACGIAGNDTLEHLEFEQEMEVELPIFSTIIGGLVCNKKLGHLDLGRTERDWTDMEYTNYVRTLSAVAQANTTLLHIPLHHMYLGAKEMDEFMSIVGPHCRWRTLDLWLTADALVVLGRGLENEGIVIDNVKLPYIEGDEDTKPSLKTFIESLKRIKRRFEVEFNTGMDDELLELLLQAAKEKKNLVVDFARCARGNAANADLLAELEFEVKLNRFGRCLFGSTSLPSGLWPTILAPMAKSSTKLDSAALFCFVREFFCSPSNPYHISETAKVDESRPNKRARFAA